MKTKSYWNIFLGIATLAIIYVITGQVVKHYRPSGAMTVIEAQAMDMNAMSAATPLGSIPVATEEVSLHSFAPSVTYTGSVVAFNDSEVYPRVTGTLTSLMVYPGDRVRVGRQHRGSVERQAIRAAEGEGVRAGSRGVGGLG